MVTLSGPVRVIANTLYTYSATVANATASAWSWLWGDGSTDSITNPATKVWYKPGSYSSTLTATTRDTPATATQAVTVVAPIDAGDFHNCALQVDATVRCWGSNNSGQLGDGSSVNKNTPNLVSGLAGVVALATGYAHSCALQADGAVRCWGYNGNGQLGDGTTVNKSMPITVLGLAGVSAISAGNNHTCSLQTDSTVRCWGANNGGQLGNGTTVNTSSPAAVPSILSLANVVAGVKVAALATGYTHSCALKTDGAVRCWGVNSAGQIGDGTTTQRLVPTAVAGGAVFWN